MDWLSSNLSGDSGIYMIPVLIFTAMIMNVTISTIRIVFIARGMKILAPALGFFEVMVWLLAISQIMQNLTNWVNYLAFALGFVLGNYIGLVLEKRIALGKVSIRIINRPDTPDLAGFLRARGYALTSFTADGPDSPVKVIILDLSRKALPTFIKLISEFNPQASFTIEDVCQVSNGLIPSNFNVPRLYPSRLRRLKGLRKV